MNSFASFGLSMLVCAAVPQVAAAAQAPAHSAPPAAQTKSTALAPADSYFGPFGMSPLSIRSTIGLLGREYHQRTISDHDLLRKALLTEDALRKWRTSYPADTWLAPTFYHLEQLYQAVQSDEARKHATAILNEIVRTYPATKEGHLSRSRLSAGFPALVSESPVVASPPPDTSPAPASPAPDAAPASGVSPAANASPMPAATPSATPSKSPRT